MIETVLDCTNFRSEILDGDLIMHIVPTEDGVHPANNSLCLLFIRSISSGKTYHYSFNHPDSVSKMNHLWFIQEVLFKLNNRKWALDKKAFTQLINLPGVLDANLCGFLKRNEVLDLTEFETPAHNLVRRNCHGHGKINCAIPLMKHKETFDDLCDDIIRMIREFDVNASFYSFNHIIETLGEIEANGIFVDAPLFEKHFESKPNGNGLVFSQYNVYTATGRPSNRYGGINYAAMNHSDGSRSCFVSRYGKDGRMVVIDYTAFHPRIICNLTNYTLPIETDIYEYLAKLYFQKKVVDEDDIRNAKKLTFLQLYNGVEEQYAHIKYLTNLKTYEDEQWDFFQKNGYIETPIFKRRITDKHIQDPSPTKVFNYIMQAVEGEIAIPRIQMVMDYLCRRPSKCILYTYDSILLDYHMEDGLTTLNHIRQLMSCNGMFPMKTYIGNSYHDIQFVTV